MRHGPGEDDRSADAELVRQALELGLAATPAHDQALDRPTGRQQPSRALEQHLVPLSRVVQAADVADDRAATVEAVPAAIVGIGLAWGEGDRIHPVRDDVDLVGRDAAGDDLGAHRLGDRDHRVHRVHRSVLGLEATPVLLGALGVLRVAGPAGLQERAHLVHDRHPVARPEGDRGERGLEPAMSRVGVDDGGTFLADDPGGEPGRLLEGHVRRRIARVPGAEIEAVVGDALDRLPCRDDIRADTTREPERRHHDGLQAHVPLRPDGVRAPDREPVVEVRDRLLLEVQDHVRRAWGKRLGRTGQPWQPPRLGLDESALDLSLRHRQGRRVLDRPHPPDRRDGVGQGALAGLEGAEDAQRHQIRGIARQDAIDQAPGLGIVALFGGRVGTDLRARQAG